MTTVDIPNNDFDYYSLLDNFNMVSENKDTPPMIETDPDCRTSTHTPRISDDFQHQIDTWAWNMESPLSDGNQAENYDFNSLINNENPFILPDVLTDSDSSTLDELLAGFELPEQTNTDASQLNSPTSHLSSQHPYPSPPPSANIVPSSPPLTSQRPVILPKPVSSPSPNSNNNSQQQISNCIKLQSFSGVGSSLTKCVKIEPIIHSTPQQTPSNITIITTAKPITVTKFPVIKMPLANTNTPTTNITSPITFVKTEAPDTATPANIKRIATVFPNASSVNNENAGLSTAHYLRTLSNSSSSLSPPAKRRRSESSTSPTQIPTQSSEINTLTLDQLKVQYSNVSEEALKKHLRMIKNRESASLSRKRRKQLMENLEVKVKELSDENEKLKNENTKLLTRVHTLEMENELLKTYKIGNGAGSSPARKPLILMGIVLLVVFNVFTLRSLSPTSNDLSGSLALYENNLFYDGERTIVRGRTILSNQRSGSDDSLLNNNDNYDGAGLNGNSDFNSSFISNFPYWQCLAYINKTHSQRINRELHSWVQDHYRKEPINDNSQPVTISSSKSITIPSKTVSQQTGSVEASHQHVSRKVALLNRRQSRLSTSNEPGQLQPYKGYESSFDDFIHTIDRRNDTLYFVSFKRDHLILPATVTNQTQRPKMSLILPASMTNLNKSIHIPPHHIPMIQIDCEVEDTKLVFVKRAHIPSFYRQDLFRYYSSVPQTTG